VKTKIFALLILAMIALTTIGYSYACWNGGITIDCYCKSDVAFTNVITSDNEIEKDVAKVDAQITNEGNSITACITNAYPCYRAYINYTIKNTGCKSVHFDSVTIINDHPEALEITTTNHTCTWLSSCETVQGTTTVHILQPAKENWQYNFQIKIGFSCQTGYPRTIGFWKNQFSTALCKIKGHQQVSSSKLEQYLNQTSSLSEVFEFTGSQKDKFNQALNILEMPRRPTMEDKLKAQLLALWLNYVAGWTGGYKYKGMTAQEIIQGSESALLTGATDKYEYWKNLCDRFNNIS